MMMVSFDPLFHKIQGIMYNELLSYRTIESTAAAAAAATSIITVRIQLYVGG